MFTIPQALAISAGTLVIHLFLRKPEIEGKGWTKIISTSISITLLLFLVFMIMYPGVVK